MQRKFRLTRSEDFKRVRRSGKSYAHPLVVLIVLEGEESDPPRVRVGVTAGRTVGTAVTRNRAKRILREAVRPLLPDIASNLNLVLIARAGLATASLVEARQAIVTLLERAKIHTLLHEP